MFILAGRLTPFVGVEHEGVRYLLSTKETDGVNFSTFIHRTFDEETICRMSAALKRHAGIATLEGLNVLEVGANIGTETVSMLVRHGVRHIVAFEPDLENALLLRANLALNDVEGRVCIHQIALSDADVTLTLERSETNWGDHRIRLPASGPDLRSEGQRAVVEVAGRSVDSLADTGEIDLNDIDLAWMDAQGHEAHILAGAEQLFAAGIPILTEYWPYGLRRVGSLDRFHTLVAKHCSKVVDLRTGVDEQEVVLDATCVADLADRYVARRSEDPVAPHTDLLLLNG
jgi:FkbM family methyltransferase